MKKLSFLIAISLVLFCLNSVKGKSVNAFQQDSISRKGFVLYLNQPNGFINKVRFKVGYKFENKSSFLIVFSKFFNNSTPVKFDGFQICTEYQYVFQTIKKTDYFIYGKAGIGDYSFTGKEFSLFNRSEMKSGSGNYVLLGAGFGQELFINKSKSISLQFNEGLKFCKTIKENDDSPGWLLLYPFSPGSLIDLNINFGFKF